VDPTEVAVDHETVAEWFASPEYISFVADAVPVTANTPCAVAGARVSTLAVSAVGAWKHFEFAVLQGATEALVLPCGKSKNPAVVPLLP
jgi:hypothetical protein